MKSNGMHLAWITVADIKSSIKFYTETIGFELFEFNEEFGWAEVGNKDGARLGIAQFTPQAQSSVGTNAVVTISVDDIETSRKELLEAKVHLIDEIIEVPGVVKMQTFQDPDGNTFQLCQILDQ